MGGRLAAAHSLGFAMWVTLGYIKLLSYPPALGAGASEIQNSTPPTWETMPKYSNGPQIIQHLDTRRGGYTWPAGTCCLAPTGNAAGENKGVRH